MCSPYHTLVIHFTGPHIKGYHPDPHLATSYPFQCPFFRFPVSVSLSIDRGRTNLNDYLMGRASDEINYPGHRTVHIYKSEGRSVLSFHAWGCGGHVA